MEIGWKIILAIGGVVTVLTTIFFTGVWVGKVNSDRTSFKEFMSEIREDIKAIREDIKNIFSRLPPNLISSGSPIKLTDLGEKVSETTNAKEWATIAAKELFEKTQGKDALDIQQFSFDHAQNFEPEEALLKDMRSIAYDSGVSLDKIREVFGVELRDQLLKLHKMESSELDT